VSAESYIRNVWKTGKCVGLSALYSKIILENEINFNKMFYLHIKILTNQYQGILKIITTKIEYKSVQV